MRLSRLLRSGARERLVKVQNTNLRFDLQTLAAQAANFSPSLKVAAKYSHRVGLSKGSARGSDLEALVLEHGASSHLGVFVDGIVVLWIDDHLQSSVPQLLNQLQGCSSPQDVAFALPESQSQTFRCTTLAEFVARGGVLPDDERDSFIAPATDTIVVPKLSDARLKLPFMVCLAESVRLDALNKLLLPTATVVDGMQATIRETGGLPFDLSDLRMLNARLHRLAARHERAVTVKKFWESDLANSRYTYNETAEHFELHQRSEEFRSRLNTVQSTLRYICEEKHQGINHHLELLIIALICVEVVLAFKHHLFE